MAGFFSVDFEKTQALNEVNRCEVAEEEPSDRFLIAERVRKGVALCQSDREAGDHRTKKEMEMKSLRQSRVVLFFAAVLILWGIDKEGFCTSGGPDFYQVTVPGSWTEDLGEGDYVLAYDGSYFDIYEFNLSAPANITVTLSSVQFDTYLLLAAVDPVTWTILDMWQNDDYSGTDSGLTMDLQPGTYWIAANSYEGGATGGYTLGATLNGSTPTQTYGYAGYNECDGRTARLSLSTTDGVNFTGTMEADPVCQSGIIGPAIHLQKTAFAFTAAEANNLPWGEGASLFGTWGPMAGASATDFDPCNSSVPIDGWPTTGTLSVSYLNGHIYVDRYLGGCQYIFHP